MQADRRRRRRPPPSGALAQSLRMTAAHGRSLSDPTGSAIALQGDRTAARQGLERVSMAAAAAAHLPYRFVKIRSLSASACELEAAAVDSARPRRHNPGASEPRAQPGCGSANMTRRVICR